MRGILFTGGLGPNIQKARSLLGKFDFVIAADSGLHAAEKAGIIPDLIVGDMDSLKTPSILVKYPADHIKIWPREKDYTDTELALSLMKEKGVDDVVLVGGCGGRMDHFFALRSLFDKDFCPSLWIGDESTVVLADSGRGGGSLRVSGLVENDPVSVFAAGIGNHQCRGSGFHWEIDSLSWESGIFSLSNHAESGTITLEALSGRFLLVVPFRSSILIERI